ncbi:MAG: hypothetical protein A2Y45_08115 [Tenericutes bacterium GWC2_34_14]|nr:MAG: hypothetical protein A2Y45_08115 [Tenericutes bacterium GWC2_34_14]OHE34841.1 MAG: hypothetical protein A2012_01725 [Tenericutes bacterium GWE2_34_108]OHE37298.1 MAG: hypothetical protein A2Y46_01285 [Tenericutes bacterium GWF1_35_14]OHE39569.1 MAG: hypothetical protein A2Y44_01575 [Tenericutes bacterium GWF2_35_184]OHE43163.1 MAG: hypothetical protein A3K26_03030 [Tenericutes bacterium RIFOXYA12_FULL_35_10]OHE44242.1 MAG: hypothetical protein A2221_03935 [Tenericutes bacterium RIFOXYA
MKLFKSIVYLLLVLVSSILPIFSFDDYSLISNTTSHLGAQGSPYAWVMNITFMILGISALIVLFRSNIKYHVVFGFLFGVSLILTGIFRHANLVDPLQTVIWKDQMHSLFATTTGVSFVFLSFGQAMMTHGKQRVLGITMALLASLISLFMMMYPSIMGILQRIMFLSSFYWLFFIMVPNPDKAL